MSSRLKRRFGENRHRGVIPNTQGSTNKKVFCPLCCRTQDIQMQYDSIKQIWVCPFCGHSSDPKLSQIALSSKSQLKASNDIYTNRSKVFFGSQSAERKHRRIDSFLNQTTSLSYQKSKVYQSLMQAEQATNIIQDPDELD